MKKNRKKGGKVRENPLLHVVTFCRRLQYAIVSIEEGLKDGKIKDGDLIVLAAAGIGWSWNAMTIKWGKVK
ncbi:MAG: 3-oxoacyl-[acyl-carrier-protein] synthase III C-terminal domain-containing protein [Candidatus Thorarchaeota archaeon]